jgi:hypothetical protein
MMTETRAGAGGRGREGLLLLTMEESQRRESEEEEPPLVSLVFLDNPSQTNTSLLAFTTAGSRSVVDRSRPVLCIPCSTSLPLSISAFVRR